jgi:biopolymer transport protein ExbB
MRPFVAWKNWALVFAILAGGFTASEAVISWVGPRASSAALAQDEEAADAPAADAPAADAPAAPAPAAADAPAGPPPQQSMLMWFFGALGWRYTVAFLFISFTFVAVLVMNLLTARRDAICPRHLVEAFEANVNEKKFQEAFDLAKNDDSMLGQMLAAGMTKLQQGYDKAIEAMGQVGEDENMKLEHRLAYISLIASIAPMVGLLGTVDGMVGSFQKIAIGGATPKASELAEGISMALITTLVGLVIAIPAIVAFNLLKNRMGRLTMEVGQAAGNLMSRFESMGKK